LFHLVADHFVSVRVMDRLTATKAPGRTSHSLELFFRFHGLEYDLTVGPPYEPLRPSPELPGAPAPVLCIGEDQRDDLNGVVHVDACPKSPQWETSSKPRATVLSPR
jgi:hypothetical protein